MRVMANIWLDTNHFSKVWLHAGQSWIETLFHPIFHFSMTKSQGASLSAKYIYMQLLLGTQQIQRGIS